jgi:hypothetical protein
MNGIAGNESANGADFTVFTSRPEVSSHRSVVARKETSLAIEEDWDDWGRPPAALVDVGGGQARFEMITSRNSLIFIG